MRHWRIEPSVRIARSGCCCPCNVLVRADPDYPDTVIVEAMDPRLLVEVTGEPALIAIAAEVTEKMRAAIASLTESD